MEELLSLFFLAGGELFFFMRLDIPIVTDRNETGQRERERERRVDERPAG